MNSVLLDVQDSVATITFNRPEALNAFDLAMAEVMLAKVQACMEDDAIRAVILTGAGRAFSAGGDIKAVLEIHQSGGDVRQVFRDLILIFHRIITDLRRMEKPVITAINGSAGGGGMSFAVAGDLRIAAESAKFKQAYTSIGLSPDGGWTVFVPQLIGLAKATELLLLDPVFDAQEALNMGLVNEVVPDDQLMARVGELAAQLAAGPTTSFGGAKQLLNAVAFPDLEAQLERERQRVIYQSGTADFIEGLTAFIEKRPPQFKGH